MCTQVKSDVTAKKKKIYLIRQKNKVTIEDKYC